MMGNRSRPLSQLRIFLGLAFCLVSGLAPTAADGIIAEEAGAGTCVSSPTTLCLQGDRFEVEIDWTDGPDLGDGQVLTAFGSDTGVFSFTDPDAAEVLIKVLDGCSITGSYWVFFANVSNLGQVLTVTDTVLGNQTFYSNTEGTFGNPVTDTAALPCAPPLDGGTKQSPRSGSLGSEVLVLAEGRFQVEVTYEDASGSGGVGQVEPLTDRSGAFSLFVPGSLELLIKVEPNPAADSYAVVFSPLTNVALDITVTDTCNGQVRSYVQTLGTASTVADGTAFPLECPTVFDDGFESGDAAAWSSSVGFP